MELTKKTADRIRAFGYSAPETYSEFVALTSIKEVKGQRKAEVMLQHLISEKKAVVEIALNCPTTMVLIVDFAREKAHCI